MKKNPYLEVNFSSSSHNLASEISHQNNSKSSERLLVVSGESMSLNIILVSTGYEIQLNQEIPEYHRHWINRFCWSKDNSFIFSSSDDKSFILYDVSQEKKLNTLETSEKTFGITNRNHLVYGTSGNELILCDTRDFQCKHIFLADSKCFDCKV